MMILVVCLNPALQRTLIFNDLALRRVNRASSVRISVGGKGANVARVLRTLGAESRLLLPLGGARGRDVKELLRRGGVPFRSVPVHGETRVCTTLIDASSSAVTELVEESGLFSGNDIRATQAAFGRLLPSARLLILSGTAPAGFSEDVYGRWITQAGKAGIPTLLDAAQPFAGPGLAARPWFYRANWMEMEGVLGGSVPAGDAFAALEELRGRGARNILISREGPHAVTDAEGRIATVTAPNLKTVNSIGSGDAMAAGIGAASIKGKDVFEIIRMGMACGAANVLTPTAGTVRSADVRSLMPRIRFTFR
jgi:tagatose 6-phosphate kinase